jgi:hypothetical protein
MKYNFKYFVVFLLSCTTVWAAFDKKESGAREQSLGNAVVAMHNSAFALIYNPANIQSASAFNVFTSYRNFYGVPEIYQADIIANTAVYNIPVAIAVSKYGNDLYAETEISAGGSYKIYDNLSLGISLQGYFLSIKNYGESQSWGINLGIQYNYLESLSIGAFVSNINQPTIGSIKEDLPQTFALGFQYRLMEKGTLYLELFRDVKHEQDYRAGFEYQLFEQLFLRMGIMDNTNTYSFGLGSSFGFMHFDYALLNHSILGVSHVITLGAEI